MKNYQNENRITAKYYSILYVYQKIYLYVFVPDGQYYFSGYGGGGAESFVFTRYLLLDETVWISIVDLMMPSEAELSVTDAVGCLVMDPL